MSDEKQQISILSVTRPLFETEMRTVNIPFEYLMDAPHGHTVYEIAVKDVTEILWVIKRVYGKIIRAKKRRL